MDEAMSYLARCKAEMRELVTLVETGKLPEAIARYHEVESLLGQQTPSLQGTEVYVDVQVRFESVCPVIVLTCLVAKIQGHEGQS